jgi:hypothetical protein
MGCGSSVVARPIDQEDKTDSQNGSNESNKPPRSPLTKEQINSRIVCSPKTVKAKVSDKLNIRYAHVSQRGYYPDGTSELITSILFL